MVRIGRIKSSRDFVEECLDGGITDPGEINRRFITIGGKKIDHGYIRKIKASRRADAANTPDPGAAAGPGGPYPVDSIPGPEDTKGDKPLISGQPMTPEIGTAPLQEEAESLARSYEKETPRQGAPIGGGAAQLEVNTVAAPTLPTEKKALDLTMFAKMPVIVTAGAFSLPKVKKFTEGYELDDEDKANIEKYSKELFEKYSKGAFTKYAEELNFFGALITPWIKASWKKIGALFSKKDKAKEEAKPKDQDKKAPAAKPEPVIEKAPAFRDPPPLSAMATPEERDAAFRKQLAEINSKATGD